MSDDRLRELERAWKASGAPAAQEAYLLERVRVRDIDPLSGYLAILLKRLGIDCLADELSILVDDHGLVADPPVWMLEALEAFVAGTPLKRRIPRGYPQGLSGLVNILNDIDHEVASLGKYDRGDTIEWVVGDQILFVSLGSDTLEILPSRATDA